jgi:hypothetical protein
MEDKSDGQNKAKRHVAYRNRRERALVVGSYLTHNPFNVANMQIVRSSNNRSFKISISHQCNFLFYNKGQSTLKNNINTFLKKLNGKRQGQITFRSFFVEKMSTLLDETIHITLACVVHLHGHWNKMVPLMKPFILADINNNVKFHNCTCWLIMTFVATIFHVKSIATTLVTKTWSS